MVHMYNKYIYDLKYQWFKPLVFFFITTNIKCIF